MKQDSRLGEDIAACVILFDHKNLSAEQLIFVVILGQFDTAKASANVNSKQEEVQDKI